MTTLLPDSLLKMVEAAVEAMPAFQEVRRAAYEKILVHTIPSQREGRQRHFPLQKLLRHPWRCVGADLPAFSSKIEASLVFLNGRFSSEHSSLGSLPEEVIALPLSLAEKKFKTHVRSRFQKILNEEDDLFSLLNIALQGEGLFLYIPSGAALSAPLRIVNFITEKSGLTSPRFHLHVGPRASVSLHLTTQSEVETFWNNSEADVTLEEGSRATWVQTFPETLSGWNHNLVRAHLKGDATLQLFTVNQSQGVTQEHIRLTLAQENARASVKCLSHLKGEAVADTTVNILHAAPATCSLQHMKAALDGCSKHRFFGQVTMEQGAKKGEAEQRSQHLLLSKEARGVATPRLRIHNHDVKAAHGATTSDIDAEALFYLQARGISLDGAKKLLVQGFCDEILRQIEGGV